MSGDVSHFEPHFELHFELEPSSLGKLAHCPLRGPPQGAAGHGQYLRAVFLQPQPLPQQRCLTGLRGVLAPSARPASSARSSGGGGGGAGAGGGGAGAGDSDDEVILVSETPAPGARGALLSPGGEPPPPPPPPSASAASASRPHPYLPLMRRLQPGGSGARGPLLLGGSGAGGPLQPGGSGAGGPLRHGRQHVRQPTAAALPFPTDSKRSRATGTNKASDSAKALMEAWKQLPGQGLHQWVVELTGRLYAEGVCCMGNNLGGLCRWTPSGRLPDDTIFWACYTGPSRGFVWACGPDCAMSLRQKYASWGVDDVRKYKEGGSGGRPQAEILVGPRLQHMGLDAAATGEQSAWDSWGLLAPSLGW